MSINDVKINWSDYCLLVKIIHASINGKIVLNHPNSPVPNFPNDPNKWSHWISVVETILSLGEAVEITDEALRKVTQTLSASHNIAKAISVDSPNEDTIESLIDNLNKLNKAIKSDQRFHAALAIGSALSKEIEEKRNQA